MRWRLYYAENQEQQVIISILFCETLSVLMFCVLFSPFERTGRCDNLVCCTGGRMRVTLTAGVHGEMSRLQKTQNFRNIGAKNTQNYDIMRGELSAFWSLVLRNFIHAYIGRWWWWVITENRKYYLFSFLHIHDPGARAQCLVTPQINSWMMTFECRGQANNPSHLYTLLSSRPSAYVWSDSLRTDSMPFFRGAFSQAV